MADESSPIGQNEIDALLKQVQAGGAGAPAAGGERERPNQLQARSPQQARKRATPSSRKAMLNIY